MMDFYVTKLIFVFYYKVIRHELFYVKKTHSHLFFSLKECFMVWKRRRQIMTHNHTYTRSYKVLLQSTLCCTIALFRRNIIQGTLPHQYSTLRWHPRPISVWDQTLYDLSILQTDCQPGLFNCSHLEGTLKILSVYPYCTSQPTGKIWMWNCEVWSVWVHWRWSCQRRISSSSALRVYFKVFCHVLSGMLIHLHLPLNRNPFWLETGWSG